MYNIDYYMFTKLISFLVRTPFYPHWLDFMQSEKSKEKAIMLFKGKVLETGCGNAQLKEKALKINKKIKQYMATDYSSWDNAFTNQARVINRFGKITQSLYGISKDNNQIDRVCNALDLPFEKNTFDTYFSHSVLEHIEDPVRFFQEAFRVLKRKGKCITFAPFLYREHGGKEYDYYRLSRGAYIFLSKKVGFKTINIYPVCYFGTTLAVIINQYIIRKIMEGNIVTKTILLPLSSFIFFFMNIFGYFLDSLDHDARFSLHYLVTMEK